MRDISQRIITSQVPVITWVAPAGARAASAGFFILEAGDVAAMAPGTNTGAAHPVLMGGEMDSIMKEKVENDAAASLRSVTTRRGRNSDLAEKAVRESKSFTEKEALDSKLIEIIAANENDLRAQLDGRVVKRFNGSEITLQLHDAEFRTYEPNLRQKILSSISDPNMALILLVIGAFLIYVEFGNPGMVLPGVFGAACLLAWTFRAIGAADQLAGRGLANYGDGDVRARSQVCDARHSHRRWSRLDDLRRAVAGRQPAARITNSSLDRDFGIAALALITAFLLSLAVRARANKVVTGVEGMIGEIGRKARPQYRGKKSVGNCQLANAFPLGVELAADQ